jgi:formyltetrahydrofolate synthetase
MFSKTILLSEATLLAEQEQQIMNEEFSYESFITWATRKLKGYSVKEIDHLAKRVVNIDTHEEKTDVIERIRDAVKEANEKLAKKVEAAKDKKDDEVAQNEVKYMKEHLGILRVLLSKAQSFNIVDHLEAKKGQQSGSEEKDKIRIDDNT